MSIEVTNVQRLRMYTEFSTAFATDTTGTLAAFSDVPFIEGSAELNLGQVMLNPEHAQQHIDGHPTQVLGIKECTLSFAMNLAPTGTAAANGITHPQSVLGEVLAATIGVESLGVGNGFSTGTSATNFGIAGNTFVNGDFIGAPTGTNAAFEIRPMKTSADPACVARMAYSSTPNGAVDTAFGCATYGLGTNPLTSLQFIVEGLETEDRWVTLGMQLESMTIDLPIGELPRMTFSLKGVSWLTGADAAYTSTGALAAATYASVDVIKTTGEFLYQTASSPALPTPLNVSSITLTPNIGYGPVKSPGGTNTVARWRRLRQAPAMSGEFVVPFGDDATAITFLNDRDNKTLKQIVFQVGNVAGSSFAIDLPTIQITDLQLGDSEGIRSQTVSFVTQLDSQTTESGTPTDLEQSAFRIAFG